MSRQKNGMFYDFPCLFGVPLFILLTYHTSLAAKSRLLIGGMAGIHIHEEGWSSAGVIPAIELALERVNNHSDILNEYYLEIDWKDSRVRKQVVTENDLTFS